MRTASVILLASWPLICGTTCVQDPALVKLQAELNAVKKSVNQQQHEVGGDVTGEMVRRAMREAIGEESTSLGDVAGPAAAGRAQQTGNVAGNVNDPGLFTDLADRLLKVIGWLIGGAVVVITTAGVLLVKYNRRKAGEQYQATARARDTPGGHPYGRPPDLET